MGCPVSERVTTLLVVQHQNATAKYTASKFSCRGCLLVRGIEAQPRSHRIVSRDPAGAAVALHFLEPFEKTSAALTN